MNPHTTIFTLLLLAICLPHSVSSTETEAASIYNDQISTTDRQLFECNGRCFIRRRRALRQCARFLRRRLTFDTCAVRPCRLGRRSRRRRGFRCVVIRRPQPLPLPPASPAPSSVVLPPIVLPASSSPAPSPSSSPAASASMTPAASTTPSASPAATPSSSVTPTPSQMCSFALSGPIGQTAIDGVCTCGTTSAVVTVYAPVTNNGSPLPPFTGGAGRRRAQEEALNCYNGCVTDLFSLACDPGSVGTFAADGQAIVDSCCTRCVSTRVTVGMGISAVTNQCLLAAP